MNKKGFTLIELLAVIVILAIIALVAVPLILKVVENSKKSAAVSSALGYIDAVEKQIIINDVNNDSRINDDTYELPMEGIRVKGKTPTSGSLTILKQKVTTAEMCINNYIVNYSGGRATASRKCNEDSIDASEVGFTPTDDNWQVSTVEQALNSLRGES